MKLIYSYLQKFLPSLTTDPHQMANDLAMIGHFVSSLEKIDNEWIYDLEIRQNRGDCLGYYGLARDLSVLYNLKLLFPKNYVLPITDYLLPISVSATNEVKRIQAIKISDLKNTPSPDWLVKFLKLHQVNSINTLVDLTNYVMFIFGLPNHAFDTTKSTDKLIWELNQKYPEFTTLDGITLKLKPEILMVNNPTAPLSLSFLGGQACAIDLSTTETIIEMAVYDRVRVRRDSRFLKTTTEAGIRLEKDLDSELIPTAFNYLISLVLQHCNGIVSSQLFDYYPQPITQQTIIFDPQKPSQYAGIDIPSAASLDILTRLGCTINDSSIIPPSIRKDISLEEDLIEEVIRFYGYNKIPVNQALLSKQFSDITPPILNLIEELKDKLVALGYDEVRSWPLVSEPLDKATAVYTQNSINSDFPVLRQSIIQSLKSQLDLYHRLKLPNPQFFEIGKIYSQYNGVYIEKYSLGIYHYSQDQLQKDITTLNLTANIETNFAQIFLDDQVDNKIYTPQNISNLAYELTSQLITLDANVTLASPQNPLDLIKEYSAKIDPKLLWSMLIIDVFNNKYTFRVTYFNCDDKTAKQTHLSAFNLT